MIKVIASDIDGTLLNSNHQLSEKNKSAIQQARKTGIQFLISTGRKYEDALSALGSTDLADGYITLSGAEIRNKDGMVYNQVPLSYEKIEEIIQLIEPFPVAVILNSEAGDCMIGTKEEFKSSLRAQMKLFFGVDRNNDMEHSPIFQRIVQNTKCIPNLKELKMSGIIIYKIFIFSSDPDLISEMVKKLEKIPDIASASSFVSNIEITQMKAQKGLAILKYCEKEGYSMDEVMVIGDSMNDYSMMSMDFGATVAMENAVDDIKKVAKHMTTSNDKDGVAYAIEKLLGNQLDDLKNSNRLN